MNTAGVLLLRTVTNNLIPTNKMPWESDLKKKERRYSVEMLTQINNTDVWPGMKTRL